MRRAVLPGEAAAVSDVTGAWGVLALMGPLARDVLRAATGGATRLSNAAFPFGTWQASGAARGGAEVSPQEVV